MEDRQYPMWEDIHFKQASIVDLHVHPSMKVSLFKRTLTRSHSKAKAFDPFTLRTNVPNLRAGGVDLLLSVVYAPEKEIVEDCKPLHVLKYVMPWTWRNVFDKPYFEVANKILDQMEAEVENSNGELKMVRSVTELDALLSQQGKRPIGVIHCLEGAHQLEENPDNLDHYFNRGVAYITLAHFYPNGIAYPCYPYPEPMQLGKCFQPEHDVSHGLTKIGEQVVEKMVDLGMLIDLSHCTPAARKRVFEIVGNRAPLMATHVGAYDINPDPYNLKDWEMKKIADSGGIIGVIFMNYWLMPHETKRGINFIMHTINRFVNGAGIEHVGVGTDYDGFTDPPDDLPDASQLSKLTQRLVAEEYSSEDITKIWGGNALRVLRSGWGRR